MMQLQYYTGHTAALKIIIKTIIITVYRNSTKITSTDLNGADKVGMRVKFQFLGDGNTEATIQMELIIHTTM